MHFTKVTVALYAAYLCTFPMFAQPTTASQSARKWYVGSSMLMLGNFDQVNNPEYIQLNLGYYITPNDVVSLRFKRSVYAWPLGIPFGPSFDAPGLNYPGHARILAPTLGYQRFLWKGLYTAVYTLHAFEKYYDQHKSALGNGYTLYVDFYIGYQWQFLHKRFFIEPAIGVSYWPLRTGVPDAFKAVEQRWHNYFIQPGIDIGFRF